MLYNRRVTSSASEPQTQTRTEMNCELCDYGYDASISSGLYRLVILVHNQVV